jgi:hypothetical protein
LTTAAAAAVLGAAGPALADVTVSPTGAPQGSGVNLTFRVTNTEHSPITRVKLVLPADSPIAEVYPLSVDDWAPQITNRTLSTPLATIHGGTPATETAAAITWIAMPGKAIPPGSTAELAVAVGPLPALSRMQFTVQATYADGTSAAMPPASLALTPAQPDQEAAAHAGHGGTPIDDPPYAGVGPQAANGPGMWSSAGWILVALAAAGTIIARLRRRRAGPVADAPQADEANGPESPRRPVGAGTGKGRVSAWRYRDGPE